MKTTKSIIAALLAVLMLFSAFSVSVFADLPPLTDLKWNDDFSASFSFEGAARYYYTIYINGSMIWGYGSTPNETITREKMMPYMTAIAAAGIKDRGISGDAEFELRVYAKDSADKHIAETTSVKKTLNINDVADGKLAPSTEKWQFKVTDTSDTEKLKNAFYAAYDSDKEKLNTMLAAQGISYDQFIFMMVVSAQEKSSYTFTGDLSHVFKFSNAIASYAYTDISLVRNDISVKKVNVKLNLPKHGQKTADYISSAGNFTTDTEGVTVKAVYLFDNLVLENETGIWGTKFYGGNSYIIAFRVYFNEGYVPDENITFTVNGNKVEWVNTTPGQYQQNGYYQCTYSVRAERSFFSGIATFFHNLFMKIKYPNGMPV